MYLFPFIKGFITLLATSVFFLLSRNLEIIMQRRLMIIIKVLNKVGLVVNASRGVYIFFWEAGSWICLLVKKNW